MLIDFVHLVRFGRIRAKECRTKFHFPCLFDADIFFSLTRAPKRGPRVRHGLRVPFLGPETVHRKELRLGYSKNLSFVPRLGRAVRRG